MTAYAISPRRPDEASNRSRSKIHDLRRLLLQIGKRVDQRFLSCSFVYFLCESGGGGGGGEKRLASGDAPGDRPIFLDSRSAELPRKIRFLYPL